MNQNGIRNAIFFYSEMHSWYKEMANGDVCGYNIRGGVLLIETFGALFELGVFSILLGVGIKRLEPKLNLKVRYRFLNLPN